MHRHGIWVILAMYEVLRTALSKSQASMLLTSKMSPATSSDTNFSFFIYFILKTSPGYLSFKSCKIGYEEKQISSILSLIIQQSRARVAAIVSCNRLWQGKRR
jgi:hypothetical protein